MEEKQISTRWINAHEEWHVSLFSHIDDIESMETMHKAPIMSIGLYNNKEKKSPPYFELEEDIQAPELNEKFCNWDAVVTSSQNVTLVALTHDHDVTRAVLLMWRITKSADKVCVREHDIEFDELKCARRIKMASPKSAFIIEMAENGDFVEHLVKAETIKWNKVEHAPLMKIRAADYAFPINAPVQLAMIGNRHFISLQSSVFVIDYKVENDTIVGSQNEKVFHYPTKNGQNNLLFAVDVPKKKKWAAFVVNNTKKKRYMIYDPLDVEWKRPVGRGDGVVVSMFRGNVQLRVHVPSLDAKFAVEPASDDMADDSESHYSSMRGFSDDSESYDSSQSDLSNAGDANVPSMDRD